jgi:hypothetical protein
MAAAALSNGRYAGVCAALSLALLAAAHCSGAIREAVPTPACSRCVGETPEESAVVELLELTGVFARARAETTAVVERLRMENPQVPDELWTRFTARVADRNALTALYVPIYRRHLSASDARCLVDFYRTPLGAHFLQAGPRIQEETRAAAQSWADRIAVDLLGTADDSRENGSQLAAPADPGSGPAADSIADIDELLKLSGALAGAQRLLAATLDRLRQGPQASMLADSFWENARKRLSNEGDLLRLWAPAYAHQFTPLEIRGLIQFFRSAAGIHYVAALPAIQTESLDAGARLGREAAQRAVREVFGPLPQWRVLHPPKGTGTATQPSN